MFYANAEYFRRTLIEMTGVDPQNPNKHSSSIGDSVYYHSSGNMEDTGSTTIKFPRSAYVQVNRSMENGVTIEGHFVRRICMYSRQLRIINCNWTIFVFQVIQDEVHMYSYIN